MTSDKKHEKLVELYLRFNGYFTVPNFIVHAGDDLQRISKGVVGQYTETDLLGVRMPYQKEVSGVLSIGNDPNIVLDNAKHDFVIVETKSGKNCKPNPVWRGTKGLSAIEYLIRFLGIYPNEEDITAAAIKLHKDFQLQSDSFSVRLIVIAGKQNASYAARGVKYLGIADVIRFLVQVRGQSWFNSGIGITSWHEQWDGFMKEVMKIANEQDLSVDQKIDKISGYLKG